jgi:hypothetical protein
MYKKQKRLPTPLALLIIIFGLSSMIYLDNHYTSLTTSANKPIIPSEIRITNVSDSSFSINYLTNNETASSIELSKNKKIYLDDLDTDNISRPRYTHMMTMKNLSANELYTIKIIQKGCNSKEYCPDIKQTTGPKLDNYLEISPLKGKIIAENGQPAEGSIVYLISDKISPLSTRVDSAGLWIIPLNNLRTTDLLSRPQLTDETQFSIEIAQSPERKAYAKIDFSTIKSTTDLPVMQIGQSYDFLNFQSKNDLYTKQSTNVLGDSDYLSNLSNSTELNKPLEKIDIIFPKKELDTTTDKQPRLRGVGIPNTELTITINSITQSTKIKVNNDGIWTYRPNIPLNPGIHTVTLTGFDENGRLISISKQFIVLKSGEQVLGDSTPSASLTPTGSNISPTASISSTPIPSLIPSITLQPTNRPTYPPPTIGISPPPTGNSNALLLFVTGATGILLLGVSIFTLL